MSPSGAATFPTTVHRFESPTPHNTAFETGPADAQNALVFIGGLGDGPFTVYYPRAISAAFSSEQPDAKALSYSLFEFRLGSSYTQFGFKRLSDDVADIAAFVKYLRSSLGKRKIVLMGHSTGTQDCMEYVSPAYPDVPPVDGFILQAPACDRAALLMEMGADKLDQTVEKARGLIAEGKSEERMPIGSIPPGIFDVPISADRFYSLAAKDGGDNYFDPEYTDDQARPFWQRFEKPLLILHSGNDEYVPSSVDKVGQIQQWKTLCRPGVASDLSGTIPNADHRVEKPPGEAEKWLVDTVVKFLKQSV
ncbi:hypothetical protein PG993_002260 [Apiospora rasikravindrae]|uniref:Uncharacterized protein n=1 Tax=Apiospora rasikravindrae TaxID=990691 RepID=A0ABR1TW43_9PEZI